MAILSVRAHKIACKVLDEAHNVWLGVAPLVLDKSVMVALLAAAVIGTIFIGIITFQLFVKGGLAPLGPEVPGPAL